MKTVNNILEHRTIGSNCSTTASKIILNSYGYTYSEDMVLGLGAGLGFIYQYYADKEEYFLSGKNESLELNLTHALGGTVLTGSFDDEGRGWQTVKELIDEDIPVILDLSIRELPYFQPYLKELANIGFGLHNAILVGYDDEKEEVMLLDHRWSEPQIISYDALRKARGTKEGEGNVGSSRNAYKVLVLDRKGKKPSPEIYFAIKLNINRMRHPFAFKMGLAGIKTFHDEIKMFFEEGIYQDKEEAILTFSYLMEKLGTGGGNFRRMYGRFLNEAAGMTGDERFRQIAKDYQILAKRWKELSVLLGELVTAPQLITEFDRLMKEIEERESAGIDALESLVKEG
ncbi:MAG: DUF4872 domain-containing protein [Anaerovoracaceae bacterium]|jgi:hypothetical protein